MGKKVAEIREVVADVSGFLALFGQMDKNGLVRQFRDCIRQHIGGKPRPY